MVLELRRYSSEDTVQLTGVIRVNWAHFRYAMRVALEECCAEAIGLLAHLKLAQLIAEISVLEAIQ